MSRRPADPFDSVDAASLAALRVTLGLAALYSTVCELAGGWRGFAPGFHFTFLGFGWVKPWPGDGMWWHFVLLSVAAVGLTVGLFSRTSAAVFGIGYAYVFLLEKAFYLNHHYLLWLTALVLATLPCGACWSVDALRRPGSIPRIPRWSLWLARFQVALPYVFGGVAKLRADWLRGQPMSTWLQTGPARHLLGPVVEEPWCGIAFAWGGLLLDLLVVPALLWPRSRPFALVAMVTFHVTNAALFDIGVFPWFMIPATLILLPPNWPRVLVRGLRSNAIDSGSVARPSPAKRNAIRCLVGTYVVVHLLLPFRFLLYPGDPNWTEEGHRFAWHMMLREKDVALSLTTRDRRTDRDYPVALTRWLTIRQIERMGRDPDMLVEFSKHLRDRLREKGADVEVRATVLVSLNGRRPQYLVDPRRDLATQSRSVGHLPCIVPLHEPFRGEPWDVPRDRWPELVAPVESPPSSETD